MIRVAHPAISSVLALLVVFGSVSHDGTLLFSLGGDPAKAAAGGNGGGNGNGGGGNGGGGNGGGGNGGGGNDGGGGNSGGGNGGGGGNSGGGNGNGNAGGNGNGNSNGGNPGGGTGVSATANPSAASVDTGRVAKDSAVVKIKAYREAVLENDLAAAASALASVKSEITVGEIEQINEILGLNSETTALTTDDIFRGVREIASRQP